MTLHAILKHAKANSYEPRESLDYANTNHVPQPCRPWVFVEEAPLPLNLMFVKLAAETHFAFLELSLNFYIQMATSRVKCLIKSCNTMKHVEGGVPHDKQWLVSFFNVPCTLAVNSGIELIAIGQVQ